MHPEALFLSEANAANNYMNALGLRLWTHGDSNPGPLGRQAELRGTSTWSLRAYPQFRGRVVSRLGRLGPASERRVRDNFSGNS